MSPHPSRHASRRAFSLIELLVVLSIVATLLGLLAAAVQKARAAAAQVSCSDHLRELGLALHHFENVHGTFPSSGGLTGDPLQLPGWDLDEGPVWGEIRYSLPNPDKTPEDQMGSWCYSILPFLEQEPVYNAISYATPIQVYACPARRTPDAQLCPKHDPVTAGVTYHRKGINPAIKIDYNANGIVIQCHPQPMTRLTDITDGTSTTILLGEKALDPRSYYTGGWYWDEPALIGCNTRIGTSVYRDAPGVPFANNWGSAHTGTCSFLFVDGSIHAVRFGLYSTVVEALLTPQGGEVVANPDGY
jgi:prepilin-type N-terminal cleavage/methylation domain-containing protein